MKKLMIFFILNYFFIVFVKAQEVAIILDLKGNEIHRFPCESVDDMNDEYVCYSVKEGAILKLGIMNFISKEIILEPSADYKQLFLRKNEKAIVLRKNGERKLLNLKNGKEQDYSINISERKEYPLGENKKYWETGGGNFVLEEIIDDTPKYTLLNKKKQKITESIFDAIYHYENKCHKVYQNGKYGVLTEKGKLIIPSIYTNITFLSEKIICAENEIGEAQLFTTKGDAVSEKLYRYINDDFTEIPTGIDSEGNSVLFNEDYQEIISRNDGIIIDYVKENYKAFTKGKMSGIMDRNENVILEPYYDTVLPLDEKGNDQYWLVINEFGLSGLYDAHKAEFTINPNCKSYSLPVYYSDKLGITVFENPHENEFSFHYRNSFFSSGYSGVATAGENYICVYEYSEMDKIYRPIIEDTLVGNPSWHQYPNVDFEYAISYIYNVGENAPPSYEPILGKNGLAASATKIKRLNKEDIKRLNTLFNPIMTRIMGRAQALPVSYCYTPRDAIVFYDKNDEVVATLQVCFECNRVNASNKMKFPMFFENWRALSDFFGNQLGHPSHRK